MTLEATEAQCAAGRTAPRVSLDDIKANIVHESYFTAGDAVAALFLPDIDKLHLVRDDTDCQPSLGLLTICIIVVRNGFTLIGKSAPASAENFNAELGRQLAYEDAVRQLWPLMGYALRDRLSG